MIKPQELRIGNLVEWVFPNTEPKGSRTEWIEEREIVKIESIRQKLVGLKGSAYGWHQIQGIPITEEWLLKFGFNQFSWGFSNSFIQVLIIQDAFSIRENILICTIERINLPQIKYIHQLQNLFFALIGEELTIKE